jgi:hypothetical protein
MVSKIKTAEYRLKSCLYEAEVELKYFICDASGSQRFVIFVISYIEIASTRPAIIFRSDAVIH